MIPGHPKHTKAIKVFIRYSQYTHTHTYRPALLCVIGFNGAHTGSVVSDTLTSVSRSPRHKRGSSVCKLLSVFMLSGVKMLQHGCSHGGFLKFCLEKPSK